MINPNHVNELCEGYEEKLTRLQSENAALKAEVNRMKSHEPVAFTNADQLRYVMEGLHPDIPLAMWSQNRTYSGADIPLYTAPPDLAAKVEELTEQVKVATHTLTKLKKCKAIWNMFPARGPSYGSLIDEAIAKLQGAE